MDRIVLLAWADIALSLRRQAALAGTAVVPIWSPGVCFISALRELQFQQPLFALWTLLEDIVCWKTPGRTLETTVQIATLFMRYHLIKRGSHVGALLCWDRLAQRPVRGWRWYDCGNWFYACMWYLLRKAARHFSAGCRCNSGRERAASLLAAMRLAESRWARWTCQASGSGHPEADPRYEVLGDLLEFTLGRAYYDDQLHDVIHCLSNLACYVTEVWYVLSTNCPPGFRVPHRVRPQHFADALLIARQSHRSQSWDEFTTMARQVMIVFEAQRTTQFT